LLGERAGCAWLDACSADKLAAGDGA